MKDDLIIALAQLNPILGDLAGNCEEIKKARAKAKDADLMLMGELAISGYPPEDLVLKPSFVEECRGKIEELAKETARTSGPDLLIGTPWREGDRLYNAFLLLADGKIIAKRFKHELPNYGVFDEKRIFDPGAIQGAVSYKGLKLGMMVCEDLWFCDVAAYLAKDGADFFILPNGSPFDKAKTHQRLAVATQRYQETGLPVLYVNQVGGQDELVFDGGSFVLGHDGKVKVRLPQFQEAVALTKWRRMEGKWQCLSGDIAVEWDELAQSYGAMCLGLKDYVEKNNFPGVLLGLSGGIDSALTASVAVDALGKERVRAIMMPSRYTSEESLEDAAACAKYLDIPYDIIPIEPAFESFGAMLRTVFARFKEDSTEENIQARIRGIILMALSNKTGAMLLTTGNKSEMAVGYATLYGDMCGGYSVLKDVYKSDVFRLSAWRNAKSRVMPDNVLIKAPSAELRANQKDQDSLPPYDLLDQILEKLIEQEMGMDEITALGYDEELVKRIWLMLDRAEYKRRQSPPGVKLTSRAFGRDRRYPITNHFWKNLH